MDQSIPKLLRRISAQYPDLPGQYTRVSGDTFEAIPFRDYYEAVLDLAAGFLSLGHKRGDHVGLIADNRVEWLHSRMAIMAIGAADVPRGCDATERDLTYILSFAECRTAVLENEAQAKKVLANRASIPHLDTLVFFDRPGESVQAELKKAKLAVLDYAEMIEHGKKYRHKHPGAVEAELDKGQRDELATLIFTSGTTGEPKGVMLSHGNFLCQLPDLEKRITFKPGDRALCILPVWHSFERACEYVILNAGGSIIYSKPIGSILLADFAAMNPQLMPSVPRIWESVYDGIFRSLRKTGGITFILFSFLLSVSILHARALRAVLGRAPVFNHFQRLAGIVLGLVPTILLWPLKALGSVLVFRKIRAKLGNAFVGGVSGGGALPPKIDEFFWAAGVNVVEGYGLTETAPVVAVRPFKRPVFGTVGKALACCEIKIVGEDGKELPPRKKGTVMVRGENVMKGYYRKPELTAKCLFPDGWLDTGDLGYKTVYGELILRGRKKDTIVLRGGENIEPLPIEMKINESRYISQSVVLGQDQRYLGVLIVVNRDELLSWAAENDIETPDFASLLAHSDVKKLYENEIGELVNAKNGFRLFERINRVALLEKPFEPGRELSAKQEIMRFKLDELYKKEIKTLFD
jgi:long-chain acyl-CoA synthetase